MAALTGAVQYLECLSALAENDFGLQLRAFQYACEQDKPEVIDFLLDRESFSQQVRKTPLIELLSGVEVLSKKMTDKLEALGLLENNAPQPEEARAQIPDLPSSEDMGQEQSESATPETREEILDRMHLSRCCAPTFIGKLRRLQVTRDEALAQQFNYIKCPMIIKALRRVSGCKPEDFIGMLQFACRAGVKNLAELFEATGLDPKKTIAAESFSLLRLAEGHTHAEAVLVRLAGRVPKDIIVEDRYSFLVRHTNADTDVAKMIFAALNE